MPPQKNPGFLPVAFEPRAGSAFLSLPTRRADTCSQINKGTFAPAFSADCHAAGFSF